MAAVGWCVSKMWIPRVAAHRRKPPSCGSCNSTAWCQMPTAQSWCNRSGARYISKPCKRWWHKAWPTLAPARDARSRRLCTTKAARARGMGSWFTPAHAGQRQGVHGAWRQRLHPASRSLGSRSLGSRMRGACTWPPACNGKAWRKMPLPFGTTATWVHSSKSWRRP